MMRVSLVTHNQTMGYPRSLHESRQHAEDEEYTSQWFQIFNRARSFKDLGT